MVFLASEWVACWNLQVLLSERQSGAIASMVGEQSCSGESLSEGRLIELLLSTHRD
jgi:hypothetical protein